MKETEKCRCCTNVADLANKITKPNLIKQVTDDQRKPPLRIISNVGDNYLQF